jgi:hypothetical protein
VPIWIWPTAAAVLVGPAKVASAAQASGVEQEAIIGVLSAYHTALQAGEPQKVVKLVGPSYFMADENSSGGSDRLKAHLFLAGQKLESWPSAFLDDVGPYRNEFSVVSVSVRGDAAVAVTRDTGSNRFRAWQDEEVAWFLGRSSGQWRIVGLLIRDIQLPKER